MPLPNPIALTWDTLIANARAAAVRLECAAAAPHAGAAQGTQTGGGDWEVHVTGPLGEVWMWADRYLPFERPTLPMREARAALRSLAAAPEQILDASYAGHKPAKHGRRT
jgi:hypothetical protein